MTLRYMKIFVSVYEHNSITKAADVLHLAQPSVSLAIKEMEEYYGTRFFERIGRHISPTGAGNELYRYALHIIELFDEMEQKIKDWDHCGTLLCARGINLSRKRNIIFTAMTRSKAWVRVSGIGDDMDLLIQEFNSVKERNFQLEFTYPDKSQRKNMRIIHRDMTQNELRDIRKSNSNLADITSKLANGEIRKEDLDEDTVMVEYTYTNEMGIKKKQEATAQLKKNWQGYYLAWK